MFILHVDLQLKPGAAAALARTFSEVFRPAISAQPGFGSVLLLRPGSGQGPYRLVIAFDSHDSQQRWVASDLHQRVWPQMEEHCSGFTVSEFESV